MVTKIEIEAAAEPIMSVIVGTSAAWELAKLALEAAERAAAAGAGHRRRSSWRPVGG